MMNLNLELGKLLELLGEGECSLDRSFFIKNIASLEKATSCDLAVIIDRGDQSVFEGIPLLEIQRSSAGLFLAVRPIVEGKNYLLVKDPLGAFQKIVDFVKQQSVVREDVSSAFWVSGHACVAQDVSIAPGAVISAGAQVGAGTVIGAHVFIGANSMIGSHVILHVGVKVLDGCSIGDYSIIHAGTVIGSDGFGYQVTKVGLRKIPQVGSVRIGRQVEIGANCAIDRASFDETVIGDGVKIDNGVHIAHNVEIGAGTAILAQTGIAGGVRIGVGCQIGGQVALKDHLQIGNGVKIVSKSAVMHNLADGQIVAGIPAIPFTQWKRLSVVLAKLPDMVKSLRLGSAEKHHHKKSWWKRLFFREF